MQDAKRRAIIFAILSVVMATFAAFLFLQESNQLYAGLGSEQTVLVATKDIKSREPLTPEHVKAVPIPEKYMNQSMVTNVSEIEGQVLVVPIREGDQLTKNMLRPAAQLSDPSSRMVLLRASDRVLFDESFTAQDRVDIIVSYQNNPETGEGRPQTKIFMRDKLVHSVAQDNRAIGLELSLNEAQELIFAENFAHSIRVVKAPQKKDRKERDEKRSEPSGDTNGEESQGQGQVNQPGNTNEQPSGNSNGVGQDQSSEGSTGN
jgi:Flp pilus assembly protein CpaB